MSRMMMMMAPLWQLHHRHAGIAVQPAAILPPLSWSRFCPIDTHASLSSFLPSAFLYVLAFGSHVSKGLRPVQRQMRVNENENENCDDWGLVLIEHESNC